ncbi:hypothetical protein [Pantoea sp. UBA5035]|uniref:hypothetical protein n=1 Tax=Pantoea sp. UBA5035 TaxID=1947035 RepID=UPI002579A479|nr:hypothetical protein [Pantoea sp. UBA5035]
MTTLVHLFSGGWNYVFAFFALIAAGVAAYFGGKSKGQTEEKAKADVEAAKVESQQVNDVAKVQAINTEKANSVKETNASLSDDAARYKLRKSQFNSDD